MSQQTIQRPSLKCMYCGVNEVEEVHESNPIPIIASKVPMLEYLQCRSCGAIVYKEAFFNLIILSMGDINKETSTS